MGSIPIIRLEQPDTESVSGFFFLKPSIFPDSFRTLDAVFSFSFSRKSLQEMIHSSPAGILRQFILCQNNTLSAMIRMIDAFFIFVRFFTAIFSRFFRVSLDL